MDLIEYGNKFIELNALIKAVYGGDEIEIYMEGSGYRKMYYIHTDIPNWDGWSLDIHKASGDPKRYAIEGVERIGAKFLLFGFRLNHDTKIYHVFGLKYW